MSLELLALIVAGLAAIPAVMVPINLFFYRPPRQPSGEVAGLPAVSVLIPARDEEDSIAECVTAALANRDVALEVVVMDDGSRDRTAEIVRDLAARDVRVRLESAPPLPEGWNGKQHACWALANVARHEVLVFVDADVRLAPDALRALVGELEDRGLDLLSGIPDQLTKSLGEKLVIPLIHFILLGYLPMAGMRWTRHPSFAAGCGQLFVARRAAYRDIGGHATIRESRHDGVTLPRAFRQSGKVTDLVDVTRLASCRMYRSAREVWLGFAKNATEGMASPAAIGPWTILLAGGQVAPLLVLLAAALAGGSAALPVAALATALAYAPRLVLTLRFRQSWLGALLHPLGVATVVAIQWFAWWKARRAQPVAWKGRWQTG